MRRIVQRRLPDGSIRTVQPFHICMEGMETVVLCRDEEDYDAMVKIICLCARRKNVIVIIYAVVSNHCHVAVLAVSQKDADCFGAELKRIYSMWFSRKYGENEILRNSDVKAIALDSDWYVRNALAYIPRNALDNGCNVDTYPWSGYRAMFKGDAMEKRNGFPVDRLTKVERRSIFHTGDNMKDATWLIDNDKRLIPSSFCDTDYLEQVFNGDQAFFMKTIGILNPAEMHSKLVEQPRMRFSDSEFYKLVNEISLRFFKTDLSQISLTQKYRLLPYVKRSFHTTIPQLARAFGLTRDQVSAALGEKRPKEGFSQTNPIDNEWPWPFPGKVQGL